MKMSELKDLSPVELTAKGRDLRQEIFNLRLQQASAQLEKPARLRTLRRDIARIETRISQLRKKSIIISMAEAATITLEQRGNRKERVGEVVSNKMTKTIVVRVERRFQHPRFKKIVTGYNKFYAHDEKSEAKVGDRVRIQETRPLSKTKRWRLVQVVEKASEVTRVAV